MKHSIPFRILVVLFLSASAIFVLPRNINQGIVRAQSPARLEVWSPDLHSSNITNLAFTPGTRFNVFVNVTNAGPLLGFDVTLDYNITSGPNVLNGIIPTTTGSELSGGLFDKSNPPTGCQVNEIKREFHGAIIRYAAFLQGGCTVPGTGKLFTVSFMVTGTGATSIDVVQVENGGPKSSVVAGVGNPPVATDISYDVFNGYFLNKQGPPAIPSFTYTPSKPSSSFPVLFNATQTGDPDNPNAPNGGGQIDSIIYDGDNNKQYDSGDTVIVGTTPPVGTQLGAPPYDPTCRTLCQFNLPDRHIVFNDTKSTGNWVPGDTVVYDAYGDLKFHGNDFIIAGPALKTNATLTADPKLTYWDIHQSNMWINGYFWDFGDGSVPSTGIVTSHVFRGGVTAIFTAGQFAVKLVVFDSDQGIPNRAIQIVTVKLNAIYDVAAFVDVTKPTLNVGETEGVSVRISNHGNQPIALPLTVSMNVSYDLNTSTNIGSKGAILLPTPGIAVSFNYTIDTTSLPPRGYTITVQAVIMNATSGIPIQNATPDNIGHQNFVVQGNLGGIQFNIPILVGGTVGAIAVVSSVVYLLRRRKKEET